MISGGYFYVWPNIMSTLDISKFCQISNLSLFRTRCLSISQAFVILCCVHCIVHRFHRARSFIIPWIINTSLDHKSRYWNKMVEDYVVGLFGIFSYQIENEVLKNLIHLLSAIWLKCQSQFFLCDNLLLSPLLWKWSIFYCLE